MALVEILDIQQDDIDTEHLLGAHLDLPICGGKSNVYALSVLGWVVGRRSRATHIEFVGDGVPTGSLPIEEARPDIAELHPMRPEAVRSGYATSLSVLGLSSSFKIQVQAVLEDGRSVTLAQIWGQRSPIRPPFEPALQPLMITTLARTGSTWLTHLLSHHPAIVAYRPFRKRPEGHDLLAGHSPRAG